MQLLQSLAVFFVQVVEELYHISVLAELGFLIGVIQAGVYGLGIHIKAVYPDGAAVQIEQHISAVRLEAPMEKGSELIIVFL